MVKIVDELISLIIENDIKLNNETLKNEIEEIEAFYNENITEVEYKEVMRKS